jgi:hypothetical protein
MRDPINRRYHGKRTIRCRGIIAFAGYMLKHVAALIQSA